MDSKTTSKKSADIELDEDSLIIGSNTTIAAVKKAKNAKKRVKHFSERPLSLLKIIMTLPSIIQKTTRIIWMRIDLIEMIYLARLQKSKLMAVI
jgi:hypothetical protein